MPRTSDTEQLAEVRWRDRDAFLELDLASDTSAPQFADGGRASEGRARHHAMRKSAAPSLVHSLVGNDRSTNAGARRFAARERARSDDCGGESVSALTSFQRPADGDLRLEGPPA